MKRTVAQVSFLTLLMTLGAGAAQANHRLQLVPSSNNVTVGNQLMVNVVASDFGNFTSPSLSIFDVNFSFDQSILAFNSISFGDPLLGDLLNNSGFATTDFDASIPGIVKFAEVSGDSAAELNAAQPDTFTLAVLNFNVVGSGASVLGLTLNDVFDENSNSFLPEEPPNPVTIQSTQVPEPSVSLIGFALTVGLGSRFKKKKLV